MPYCNTTFGDRMMAKSLHETTPKRRTKKAVQFNLYVWERGRLYLHRFVTKISPPKSQRMPNSCKVGWHLRSPPPQFSPPPPARCPPPRSRPRWARAPWSSCTWWTPSRPVRSPSSRCTLGPSSGSPNSPCTDRARERERASHLCGRRPTTEVPRSQSVVGLGLLGRKEAQQGRLGAKKKKKKRRREGGQLQPGVSFPTFVPCSALPTLSTCKPPSSCQHHPQHSVKHIEYIQHVSGLHHRLLFALKNWQFSHLRLRAK